MDLSDLHVFRTVVTAGGVTRAAEKLHRVQSNVTTRIRQLEDDLGTQLFIRQGKKLHLSPAGRILLEYANRLLTLAEETREALQDSAPRGAFRLGAMESTAAARLPGPLSLYHQRYPKVQLELHTGNPQKLAGKVLAGELDAALAAEPLPLAQFDYLSIYDEELVVVAAAERTKLSLPDLERGATILAFEHGCAYRKRMEDWFAKAGLIPARVVEMSSYHAMLGCVAAGMGIALLPRMVLNSFAGDQQISIHRLPSEFARARTLLIWRKGAQAAKIAALAEILVKEPEAGKAVRRPRRRAA